MTVDMQTVYDLAAAETGVWEWKDGENPVVLGYFQDAGHPEILNDETAWCAAFVGAMLKRAGYKPSGSLLARSYCDWGTAVDLAAAEPGDVIVIPRGNSSWQGHVFFFAGWNDDGTIKGLGGNQSDQVNTKSFPRSKVIAVRRGKLQRTSKARSTTLQATAATAVAGGTAAATALSKLDPAAQYIVLACAAVGLVSLIWIAKERIRRWADGDK